MSPPPGPAAPRRALMLALWLLALLAAALQVARTEFRADLSAFLPRSPDATQRILIEQVQGGAPARTLLLGIEGGDAAARAHASRELAAALRASGRFAQVANGERDAYAELGRWLFEQRYLLSPAVAPERFTAAGLRDAIADTLALLGTPAGAAVRATLEQDPSGELQRIAETLIPHSGPRTEDGVWVARSGGRALLLAMTQAAGGDLDAQQAALATVHEAFAPAAARGLVLQVSGAPRFAVDSRARIERAAHFLGLAGTGVVGALLWLAFASPAALVVAALPVATGVLAGVAAVSLVFGSVHGLTLGFGATLIGEAVDYAIYYLIQAGAAGAAAAPGGARVPGWRAWLDSGWPTLRLGLATSVCGFAALLFSGFPGLAQLGVFSIAGLVAAAAATRWVLPVLRPDGVGPTGLRGFLGRFALAALRVLPRWRRPLLALALAAAALVVARSGLWRAELASLSPLPPAALELDRRLRADLNGADARPLVVVQGADVQTTLERAEAAAARLTRLVDEGRLGGYDSVTRLLPSLATQRARQAALPAAPALETALAAAVRGGPLAATIGPTVGTMVGPTIGPAIGPTIGPTVGATVGPTAGDGPQAGTRLAPFVAAVQQARTQPLLTPEALRASPAAPLVDALLLARADGSHAALLPLQPLVGPDGQPQALDFVAVQAALAGLPDTRLLDLAGELGALYRHYLNEARTQALLGALAIMALMAASLRSARRLLAVCLPLALAVLLTLGGLAAAGVELGILHLVGLLLVVAVGSNYALFFDLLAAAEPGPELLASLLLANLTIVASFALLALSGIPTLAAIGIVVAPGTLLALVLAAAFAPARGGAATKAVRPL